MATQEPTFEAVLSLARQLTPGQKLRPIEAIVPDLEEGKPLRSLYGVWKDFGVNLSAEEIDEGRREMGGNFPRQDT